MPSPRSEQSIVTTTSLLILAAVAVAFALALTRVVLVPFVLAVFIYFGVAPLIDLLQDRLRIPRLVSLLTVLLVVAGLLLLLGLLVTSSTRGMLENAPMYRDRITSLAAQALSIFDRFDVDLGQERLLEGVREIPIMDIVRRTVGTAFGLVTKGVLVMIFVIYLLAGRGPEHVRAGIYAEVHSKITRYVITKVATSAVTGILVGTILKILGLELAFVFGVLAFLLNFVPSIGSAIATLLPVPVAVIQYESVWPILGVLVLPAIVQIVIGNGVEPILMGEGLELHPVTILLALVFWGLLWGIVGMLLAAPITAVLRIVLARIDATKTVAELLAGRLPRSPPEPQAA